jgi:hypothetical protein
MLVIRAVRERRHQPMHNDNPYRASLPGQDVQKKPRDWFLDAQIIHFAIFCVTSLCFIGRLTVFGIDAANLIPGLMIVNHVFFFRALWKLSSRSGQGQRLKWAAHAIAALLIYVACFVMVFQFGFH